MKLEENQIVSNTIVYRTHWEAVNAWDVLEEWGFESLWQGVFRKNNVWYEIGFNNKLDKTHSEMSIEERDENSA